MRSPFGESILGFVIIALLIIGIISVRLWLLLEADYLGPAPTASPVP